MRILVNGEKRAVPEHSSVAEVISDLLERTDPKVRGVAVALNEEVVPRSAWGSTRLRDDDRLEVLNAIGGG